MSESVNNVRLTTAILTELGMSRRHGTGVQLLRLFDKGDLPFFHLGLSTYSSGPSDCENSYILEDPPPSWWKRGRKQFFQVRDLLKLNWWNNDNHVNVARFQSLVKSKNLRPDVVYALPASEAHALRFVSLLHQLRRPYVVHLMDIYHEQGLDPATMPGFTALFRDAYSILALTPTIRAEVEKFRTHNVHLVPVGKEPSTANIARAPEANVALRGLLMGRVYPPGVEMLARGFENLRRSVPDLKLRYLGKNYADIPDTLKPHVEDLGFTNDPSVVERHLTESHIAYLCGPADLDCFGRYSFPSRTTDYLMAGLPVVACVAAGSATEEMLRPLESKSVVFVRAPEDIAAGATRFLHSEQAWQDASTASRDFAESELSLPKIRQTIWRELKDAARSPPEPTS